MYVGLAQANVFVTQLNTGRIRSSAVRHPRTDDLASMGRLLQREPQAGWYSVWESPFEPQPDRSQHHARIQITRGDVRFRIIQLREGGEAIF
jgi:hypothetical protein